MSTPFTTIDNTVAVCDHAIIAELIDALNERRVVTNRPTYQVPSVDDDKVQDLGTWNDYLGGIEEMCSKFLDHTQANGAGQFADFSDFPTYDFTSLQTAVGHDLWRRAQVWTPPDPPVWLTPGEAQGGDILGPWCFVDVQDAISEMRWTRELSFTAEGGKRDGFSGYPAKATPAAAIAAAEADYDAAWPATGEGWQYRVEGKLWSTSPTTWFCRCERIRSRVYIDVAHTNFPCDVDVYQQGVAVGRFVDYDAHGYAQDMWHYFETLAAVDPPVASRGPTAWHGNFEDPPTDDLGAVEDQYGVYAYAAAGVQKWHFTTSNPI